ncbi:putative ABC transporter permease/ATP-binding protein [Gordonia effusa NBRC 100432]|uniref:Putative ABC transporter permease/ATP-binding protein n=1 Tax=Gordonia effusa NBRC 100432 TaxID=1077974 RepID=H0R3S3_9ACTN|nr:ABC transporter ATP-binding protein [Gordonia effusa]GAB19724.1 putative ABC transporter permease/ATP-binding protein [Gordonia effusa NBRC 100432]
MSRSGRTRPALHRSLIAIGRLCFDRRLSALALAIIMLQSAGIAFELILPIMYGRLIDGGLLTGDASHALIIGLEMVCAVGAQALLAYLAIRLIAQVTIAIGTTLRRRLIEVVVAGSEDVADIEAGGIVTRTTRDVMQIQALLSTALGPWYLSIAITVFGLSTLFVIAPAAAPYALAILVGYAVLGFVYVRRLGPGVVRIMALKDRINTIYSDRIRGSESLRAMPHVKAVTDPFTGTNRSLRDIEVNLGKTMAMMAPTTTIITTTGAIAIVSVGAISVDSGAMQIGQLSAALTIFFQAAVGLTLLLLSALSLPLNLASVDRLHDVLGAATAGPPTEARPLGQGHDCSLSVKNLAVIDRASGRRVLDIPTLRVEAGSRVGVTGPTGAGKSVLARAIAGLISPDDGRIAITQSAATESIEPLSVCGYQGQDPYLATGTIRSNLFRDGDAEQTFGGMAKALRVAAIDGLVRRRGLDSPVTGGGEEFSVGERQRLALAVALLHSRGLVVLDDPISAVDPTTRTQILDGLFTEDHGTVIITTTDTDILSRCDHVVYLRYGLLIDVGPHRALMERHYDYRLLVADDHETDNAEGVTPG